jgi:PKD repeat protein
MGKNLTNFEDSLRETYEKYEAPYDSSSWHSIQHQLKVAEANASGNAAAWVAAIAASLFMLVSIGVAYFTVIKPNLDRPIAKIAPKASKLTADDIKRTVIIPGSKNSEKTTQRKPQKVELIAENAIENDEDKELQTPIHPNHKDPSNNSSIADNTSESTVAEIKKDNKAQIENNRYETGSEGELSFAANLKEACVGVNVSFELTSEVIEGSYLWNFGDGQFSNKPNPKHIYKKPGVYDVTLSVTSHEDGVIRSKSLKNLIIINPVPEAKFDWEYINDSAMAPRVRFLNQSERAKEAAWTIGEQGSNEINPELSLADAGEYPIKLVVSNEFGCVDSTYKYLTIEEDYKLLAPKTFSPNNDGVEDSFLPGALLIRDVDFELSIYHDNQLVYKTSDKTKPWKGQLPNGTLARPGQSFPWVVLMTNEEGLEETYSGKVTIMP